MLSAFLSPYKLLDRASLCDVVSGYKIMHFYVKKLSSPIWKNSDRWKIYHAENIHTHTTPKAMIIVVKYSTSGSRPAFQDFPRINGDNVRIRASALCPFFEKHRHSVRI